MFHSRKKLNKKGFTMVELLAAITILAIVSLIAIRGVSGLIERAKVERDVQQQKSLIIAAESYIQANSQYKPKTIGETRIINAKTLKEANYLKADITNEKGESCTKNSIVRVYKLSKTEYSYYPYIYCGDEEAPETITPPSPSVKLYFTDASGNKRSDDSNLVLTDVSKAKLAINMYGYDSNSEYHDIAIDSYSYSINVSNSSGDRTVFDSGSLSANRKSEVKLVIDLNDYVDLSSNNYFYVKVFVRNVHGGEYTAENPIDNPGVHGSFNDSVRPYCEDFQNAASEGEWINKNSAVKERTITALCEDGDGSGCIRDTFSRTWPNRYQPSAEYGLIQVKDNAGNVSTNSDYLTQTCDENDPCCVRVNVDTVSPSVHLEAYKYNKKNDKAEGNNLLSLDLVDANNDRPSVDISTKDIDGNVKEWLNNQHFTDGVIFKVKVTDDIGIASWKWETNVDGDLTGENVTLSTQNDGGAEKYFDSGSRIKSLDTFTIKLEKNGVRKGILTVRDIAGNDTKFTINLNINTSSINKCKEYERCLDDGPEFVEGGLTLHKFRSKENANKGAVYTPGEWSNLSVIASPSERVLDYVTSHPGSYFQYIVKLDNSSTSEAKVVGPFRSRDDDYIFDNSKDDSSNGKNTIALVVCTQSHNCSQTNDFDVWIDTVAPECNVSAKTTPGNKSYDGSYWLKKGMGAIVTAECADNSSKYTTSGCENSSQFPNKFSYTYNSDINTNKAGAKGVDSDGNNHGSVKDNAGNVTDCLANKTILIDHTEPVCTVTAKLNNSTDYNGSWAKKGDKITVSGVCTDTGGDGSGSGCMIYTGSVPTFDSSVTSKSTEFTKSINTTKGYPFGENKTTYVVDGAGNTVTCSPHVVKLDAIDPECGAATNAVGKNTWRNDSSITITQKCLDNGSNQSGCDTSKSYSKTYTTDTTNDSITIYDNAGNHKSCPFYVNRDTVAPTCGKKDSPEPTSYALTRTRTVNCSKGSGSAVSDCSKTSFSRTWTFDNDGKVDDSYVTISDKAGNTTDCPVKVLVNKEETKLCDESGVHLYDDYALFSQGDTNPPTPAIYGIGTGNRAFSGTVTYTHYSGGYINYTVPGSSYLYNYLPVINGSTISFIGGKAKASGFQSGNWSGNWCNNSCGGSRYCYIRVCTSDLCGKYKGWTADAMNADLPSNCRFSRCWCKCGDAGVNDWFNQ